MKLSDLKRLITEIEGEYLISGAEEDPTVTIGELPPEGSTQFISHDVIRYSFLREPSGIFVILWHGYLSKPEGEQVIVSPSSENPVASTEDKG